MPQVTLKLDNAFLQKSCLQTDRGKTIRVLVATNITAPLKSTLGFTGFTRILPIKWTSFYRA